MMSVNIFVLYAKSAFISQNLIHFVSLLLVELRKNFYIKEPKQPAATQINAVT